MDVIPTISSKSLNKDTSFDNYLLIVNNYYKAPKNYGMKNITTEEVMDKLEMFLAKYGKVDEFELTTPEIQETNVQVEVTCQTFRNMVQSIMVQGQVSDKYIHFSCM